MVPLGTFLTFKPLLLSNMHSVINTANYMYFISMEKAMNVGGEVALKIVLEEFLNLHRGQGWYDKEEIGEE
jgi:hypothetical protein